MTYLTTSSRNLRNTESKTNFDMNMTDKQIQEIREWADRLQFRANETDVRIYSQDIIHDIVGLFNDKSGQFVPRL